MVKGPERFDRRTYLTGASALLSTAVAGCSGLGSSGGPSTGDGEGSDPTESATGPAEFDDVSLDVPASPSIRSEFTVTVSTRNSGGEPGTFSDTLSVTEGNSTFQREVEIADVEPGATGTTDVPVTFQYADEYVLALDSADAQATVTPSALTRGLGESLDVGESLRITFDEVTFEQTVPVRAGQYGYYVDSDGNGVFEAPTDRILALVRFSIENIGTSADSLDFASVSGPNDNVYTSIGESDITAVDVDDPFLFDSVDGYGDDSTRYVEVQPSQTHSGWVLAQFPRSDARSEIALQFQADAEGTPPEATFVHSAGDDQFDFPMYRLDDIQAESLGSDDGYEVSATVTNTGDGSGTFDGVLQWQGQGDAMRWLEDTNATDGSVTVELAPDESQEISITTNRSEDTYTYRLAPFSETIELDFG